jgi:hypothetical protein
LVNLFQGTLLLLRLLWVELFPISFSVCSLLVYRNATGFCMLILYPVTLLKELMISNSFLVEFLESFRYRIMSANKNSLTSSFPIWIPFISCSYLIALARNSKTMLNRNGESRYPCLVPGFSGNDFSCSSFRIKLAIGCHIFSWPAWASPLIWLGANGVRRKAQRQTWVVLMLPIRNAGPLHIQPHLFL